MSSKPVKEPRVGDRSGNQVMRLGILSSHPIQYQAPWFRELAKHVNLKVFFAFQPTMESQGQGFGKAFTWDVDLLQGYTHEFLPNVALVPGAESFRGCDSPEIARRIEAERFDAFIVCGWHLKCFWQAIIACRRRGIPLLVRGDSQLLTLRSWWKKLFKEVVHRLILRQFAALLTVGERNREYLMHYGVSAGKIFKAPHFIDNDWFAEKARASDRNEIRAEWGCAPDERIVLFVGKFIPEKQASCLIRAVSRIEEFKRPIVVFVGAGKLEDELREMVRQLGIRAVFAGFRNQSQLPACYAAADVLVLPSQSETWGLVVNEAMACGTPAIVSDACGCVPDLIDEGQTGLQFPVGDSAALAQKILDYFAMLESGFDVKAALERKLTEYNVVACSNGTLEALSYVQSFK